MPPRKQNSRRPRTENGAANAIPASPPDTRRPFDDMRQPSDGIGRWTDDDMGRLTGDDLGRLTGDGPPSDARPASEAQADGRSNGASHDQIARKAYELWEQRGRQHGSDWQDWHEAEQRLGSRA